MAPVARPTRASSCVLLLVSLHVGTAAAASSTPPPPRAAPPNDTQLVYDHVRDNAHTTFRNASGLLTFPYQVPGSVSGGAVCVGGEGEWV